MLIDAKNLVAGRLASFAAKKALLGEKVDIINCEEAVITGNRRATIIKYKAMNEKGEPFHGPFTPKTPERFLRKIIKRMLPYKQEKGEKAFKRIMCYNTIPAELQGKKAETIKEANVEKTRSLKYMTLKNLCNELKGYGNE